LTKRYGNLTAVDALTLEVYEGEIFGFLGPNGAGKTTSISMMCGLLQPDAGRVFIGEQPVHGNTPQVRARVGVCPQGTIIPAQRIQHKNESKETFTTPCSLKEKT
jgi:ABC-2 type transport system ATP-binding protein